MLPNNSLSSSPLPGGFIGAGKSSTLERVVDYEDGPISEQDPSQGLNYQEWRSYIKDNKIWLESDNSPTRVVYEGVGELTDISIAFSQNADLHYAYVEDGVAKLYWFDTLAGQFATTVLPAGSRTPKVTMDDKRDTQNATNDIILSYIKDDNGLYFRMQRERFQVERLLHPGPFVMIRQMYMNDGWRLQWLLVPGVPVQ